MPSPPAVRETQRVAKGLGWFSIALGLALVGASTVGALVTRRRRRNGMSPLWIGGMSTGAVALLGGSALEVLAAVRSRQAAGSGRLVKGGRETAARIITIACAPEEVYRFWRDPANLPRFMKHVESVGVIGDRRLHWSVRGPGGIRLRWDAEIIADRVNETIVWRSLPGADIESTGSVQFVRAAGDRGTEVWLEMRYDAPTLKLRRVIAKLFCNEPGQLAHRTLRDLKQMLEVGEIVQSDASIHDGPHAARPSGPEPEVVAAELTMKTEVL